MGCCFLCQNARLNVGDGVHSMKFTCVGYQLGQVGSKANVAQQVDDMAVSLDEHEGNTYWLLYHGTRHRHRFLRIIACVLVISFDCIIIQAV